MTAMEPTHEINKVEAQPQHALDNSNDYEAAAGKNGVVEIKSEEPEKTYYSKQSVWLMILFSGLAIGSDG
jgi:hypothetical protein